VTTLSLVHDLGVWSSLPKTTFRTKLMRVCGLKYRSIQKIGTPLIISATVEASNFKYGVQLCGVGCQKTLEPNLAGSGLEEHPKILGSLVISATVESDDFK